MTDYEKGLWLAQIMYDSGRELFEIEVEASEYSGDTRQAILDFAARMQDDGK